MKPSKSEVRLKKILKRFEIFALDQHVPVPGNTWIAEFNLRPKKKSYPMAAAFLFFSEMTAIAAFFATKDVKVTAYDLSLEDDGSDSVLYVLIGAGT